MTEHIGDNNVKNLTTKVLYFQFILLNQSVCFDNALNI